MHSGKGKNVFPVFSMNEQGELYIKIVDRNLLVSNYYYGLSWTLLRLVVPDTDIRKRGVLERIVEPPL